MKMLLVIKRFEGTVVRGSGYNRGMQIGFIGD